MRRPVALLLKDSSTSRKGGLSCSQTVPFFPGPRETRTRVKYQPPIAAPSLRSAVGPFECTGEFVSRRKAAIHAAEARRKAAVLCSDLFSALTCSLL